MARVTDLNFVARVDNRQLRRDFRRTQTVVRSSMRDITRNLRRAAVAGAAAIGVLGAGLARVTKSSLDFADSLGKAASNAGLATRDFQILSEIFKQAGGNQETLTKASQTFAKNLTFAREGLSTYTRALARVNLAAEDFTGLTQAQSLVKFIDALRETSDVTTRLATAQDFLGRGGKTVLTLFEEQTAALIEQYNRLQQIIPDLGRYVELSEFLNDRISEIQTVARTGFTLGFLEGIFGPGYQANVEDFTVALREMRDASIEVGSGVAGIATAVVDNKDDILNFLTGATDLMASFARYAGLVARYLKTVTINIPAVVVARRAIDGGISTAPTPTADVGSAYEALKRWLGLRHGARPAQRSGVLSPEVDALVESSERVAEAVAEQVVSALDEARKRMATAQAKIEAGLSELGEYLLESQASASEILATIDQQLVRKTTASLKANVPKGVEVPSELVAEAVLRQILFNVTDQTLASVNRFIASSKLAPGVAAELQRAKPELERVVQANLDALLLALEEIDLVVVESVTEGIRTRFDLFRDRRRLRREQQEIENQLERVSLTDRNGFAFTDKTAPKPPDFSDVRFNLLQSLKEALAPLGKTFVETLRGSLQSAIATGNWRSIGEATVAAITAAAVDALIVGGLKAAGLNSLLGLTFHQGGIVPGSPGQDKLAVVRAGERILTEAQQRNRRGEGGNVVIQQTLVGDVDDAVRRAMYSNGREMAQIVSGQFALSGV